MDGRERGREWIDGWMANRMDGRTVGRKNGVTKVEGKGKNRMRWMDDADDDDKDDNDEDNGCVFTHHRSS